MYKNLKSRQELKLSVWITKLKFFFFQICFVLSDEESKMRFFLEWRFGLMRWRRELFRRWFPPPQRAPQLPPLSSLQWPPSAWQSSRPKPRWSQECHQPPQPCAWWPPWSQSHRCCCGRSRRLHSWHHRCCDRSLSRRWWLPWRLRWHRR